MMISPMLKLASYATSPSDYMPRAHTESENPDYVFLNDRDKVVHSQAFRRLEYKTQVFVNHIGDHYRTRLTHSLEVAQIARRIARMLNLNEDLAETVALSHDLGHPPFGHAGEHGLNLAASAYGGFDHNAHTLRILTKLEHRYHDFHGLNLTGNTIDGIAKHNGPLLDNPSKAQLQIITLLQKLGIDYKKQTSLESQVAAFADDIAYVNHDIDDGIRAGMFQLEELAGINICNEIISSLEAPSNDTPRRKHEFMRKLSATMIADLVATTENNIKTFKIQTLQDVYNTNQGIVDFSAEMMNAKDTLKKFLMQRVYQNYRVNRMTRKSIDLIKSLFDRYMEFPDCLPQEWNARILDKHSSQERAVVIMDYIAGMTDRYAIEEYNRLFDPSYI